MSRMPGTRAPGARDGRFVRPDASMSLLTNVIDHSLDEGYAAAARVRGEVGRRRMPTATRGRLVLALGLAPVAVVVTVSAVNARDSEPALAREHKALAQRVTDGTAAADKLQQQIEALRTRVDQAQRRALRSAGGAGGLAALEGTVGTGAVTGPGFELVLQDGRDDGSGGVDPRTSDGFDSTRIHDRDLQLVVNGIWQAGAEAVSINGQRLTALSAIRAAGDAVLADNRPLVPPYTVLAIGDARRLAGDFQDGPGGQYLKVLQRRYGIRYTVSAERSLDLPAAVGFTVRLAQPVVDSPSSRRSPAPVTTTGASTP
ncbi:DUF881 domain-containing protein [Kitasatospora sp. NPDC052896]|uniref:DUF881 domain-containing protein n=1 Tax=Kitasatospora sp. NPDC052896 TaxID=3364061 RepID=UPI0037CB6993